VDSGRSCDGESPHFLARYDRQPHGSKARSRWKGVKPFQPSAWPCSKRGPDGRVASLRFVARKRQAVYTWDTCDHPAEARFLDRDNGWLVCTRCAMVLRENALQFNDGGDGATSKAAKGLPRSCIFEPLV